MLLSYLCHCVHAFILLYLSTFLTADFLGGGSVFAIRVCLLFISPVMVKTTTQSDQIEGTKYHKLGAIFVFSSRIFKLFLLQRYLKFKASLLEIVILLIFYVNLVLITDLCHETVY
jgi:hypothetical protein